jgi:hypothetical protein
VYRQGSVIAIYPSQVRKVGGIKFWGLLHQIDLQDVFICQKEEGSSFHDHYISKSKYLPDIRVSK